MEYSHEVASYLRENLGNRAAILALLCGSSIAGFVVKLRHTTRTATLQAAATAPEQPVKIVHTEAVQHRRPTALPGSPSTVRIIGVMVTR